MINKEKILENVKLKISMSNFDDKEMIEKRENSSNIFKIVAVACCMIIFTTGAVVAVTKIIKYNPINGKPVIVVGENIPEELIEKEVSVMIPAESKTKIDEEPIGNVIEENNVVITGNVVEEINVVSDNKNSYNSPEAIDTRIKEYEQLEKDFESIMYKYHGEEKINQILAEMNNENPETDMITSYTFPESGKTLLRCVVEIFDTMNPTEEEKQVLREFSQMMVEGNSNKIDDEELKERINNL